MFLNYDSPVNNTLQLNLYKVVIIEFQDSPAEYYRNGLNIYVLKVMKDICNSLHINTKTAIQR